MRDRPKATVLKISNLSLYLVNYLFTLFPHYLVHMATVLELKKITILKLNETNVKRSIELFLTHFKLVNISGMGMIENLKPMVGHIELNLILKLHVTSETLEVAKNLTLWASGII